MSDTVNNLDSVSPRIDALARLERSLARPFFGMVEEDFDEAQIEPPTAEEIVQAEAHNIALRKFQLQRQRTCALKVLARDRPDLLALLAA